MEAEALERRAKNEDKLKLRISPEVGALMFGVALFVDGLQGVIGIFGLIPFVGFLFSLVGAMIWLLYTLGFWLWFHILGVTFFEAIDQSGWKGVALSLAKNIVRSVIPLVMFFLSFIPFFGPLLTGIVPDVAVAVGATILISWAQDKALSAETKMKIAQQKMARMVRQRQMEEEMEEEEAQAEMEKIAEEEYRQREEENEERENDEEKSVAVEYLKREEEEMRANALHQGNSAVTPNGAEELSQYPNPPRRTKSGRVNSPSSFRQQT
jgi:hypothetical protein